MVLAGYAEEGTLEMVEGTRYLINPGSVGQPRDGDPRAAYLVLDFDRRTATWRRIGYDIAAAQQAIVDAGLPAVARDQAQRRPLASWSCGWRPGGRRIPRGASSVATISRAL